VNIESSSLLLVVFNIELFLFSRLLIAEFVNISDVLNFLFWSFFSFISFSLFANSSLFDINFDIEFLLFIFWASKFSYNFLNILVSNKLLFDFELKFKFKSISFDSSLFLVFIFFDSNFFNKIFTKGFDERFFSIV